MYMIGNLRSPVALSKDKKSPIRFG